MKYIGKSHNLWNRMALGLEHLAFDPNASLKVSNLGNAEFDAEQSKAVSLN